MFEAAEIGQELSKADYKKHEPELRRRLIEMQQGLRVRNIPVIVLIAGDDRPGCDDVLRLLNEWLDPRFVDTNPFGLLSDEEQERPPFWRFWRSMPPKGRIGVFLGAWNSHTIDLRLSGKLNDAEWLNLLAHIRRLEQMLMADGALVVKFWLHLPKKELRKRLKAAERDPDREWRVQPEDWRIYDSYNDGLPVVENLIQQTSHGDATWRIVESTERTLPKCGGGRAFVSRHRTLPGDRRTLVRPGWHKKGETGRKLDQRDCRISERPLYRP